MGPWVFRTVFYRDKWLLLVPLGCPSRLLDQAVLGHMILVFPWVLGFLGSLVDYVKVLGVLGALVDHVKVLGVLGALVDHVRLEPVLLFGQLKASAEVVQ